MNLDPKFAILLLIFALVLLSLVGCTTTVPVQQRIPDPPAALLEVPPPLPPIPVDLPRKPR